MVKRAHIKWISQARMESLIIGLPYYPHIMLEGDCAVERWSVHFIVTEPDEKSESIVNISMLADNDESRCFFRKLTDDTKFILLEGPNQVAIGRIIPQYECKTGDGPLPLVEKFRTGDGSLS